MIPSANRMYAKWPAIGSSARGVRRGLHGDVMAVQRGRGRERDEECDDVRYAHADPGVEVDSLQLRGGLMRRPPQRLLVRFRAQFLDFLRRLPEEQVGADRRAEHGDDRGQVRRGQLEPRPHERAADFTPIDRHDQRDCDIREQRQCGPFEQARIAVVRHEDLQQGRQRAEEDDIEFLRTVQQQIDGCAHRREVGRDVDHVRDDQQHHGGVEQPRRIVGAHVRREPLARHAADARADELDGRHQRIGQQQRPQQFEAELRAGLRVGADAGRVVVGGAGDETGAEATQPRAAMRTSLGGIE